MIQVKYLINMYYQYYNEHNEKLYYEFNIYFLLIPMVGL